MTKITPLSEMSHGKREEVQKDVPPPSPEGKEPDASLRVTFESFRSLFHTPPWHSMRDIHDPESFRRSIRSIDIQHLGHILHDVAIFAMRAQIPRRDVEDVFGLTSQTKGFWEVWDRARRQAINTLMPDLTSKQVFVPELDEYVIHDDAVACVKVAEENHRKAQEALQAAKDMYVPPRPEGAPDRYRDDDGNVQTDWGHHEAVEEYARARSAREVAVRQATEDLSRVNRELFSKNVTFEAVNAEIEKQKEFARFLKRWSK